MRRYYTFAFGDINAGWYEINEEDGEISENATFMLEGRLTVNRFSLRQVDGKVTAYRVGDGDWIDDPDPSRCYPTSAYPLLVPQVVDRLAYTGLHEGDGAELDEVVSPVTATW